MDSENTGEADGGAGPGPAGAAPPTAPPSSRLESVPNKRKFTGKVFLRPHRCRCRTCPTCGPRYGYRARARLLDKAELFPRPGMLTLTVDREPWGGPIDAFLTITAEGYIRRLMRLLGVTRFVWVLEFQMKIGEGWPHWHILIDLPPGGIDLKRAWHLWRDKWHLGGLDLQVKDWHADAETALCYLTKYLIKYPEKGFPDWVDHLERRIRWVGGSRSVGPLVSDRAMVEKDAPTEEAKESLPKAQRNYAVRKIDCGQSVEFFREINDNGTPRTEFFGRLPRDVVEAGERGIYGLKVTTEPDGTRYAVGKWESFSELAGELLSVARAPFNSGRIGWTDRDRTRALGDALHKRAGHTPPLKRRSEAGAGDGVNPGGGGGDVPH